MKPDVLVALENQLAAYLDKADADRPGISPHLVMESVIVQGAINQACQAVRTTSPYEFEVNMVPPDQKGGHWEVEVVHIRFRSEPPS